MKNEGSVGGSICSGEQGSISADYPYDYRHIFSDIITETDKRKIYLHTDISALNFNYDSLKNVNPLFKNEKFLARYDIFVTCLEFFELKLKSDYYYPSYNVLYNGFGDK